MKQSEALSILRTGANVFLTGEPGSGKTHVINEYAAYLREHEVEPAVTASTGIAATHIGGFTIHSWSGIGIKRKLEKHDLAGIAANRRIVKRVANASVLIIDEISMLQPETLNMVDAVCRKIKGSSVRESSLLPFGGMQVILVGDFFQLPPIINNYPSNDEQLSLAKNNARFCYDSAAWQKAEPVVCYLSEQYRQDDVAFLSMLSAIRRNGFSEEHLCHIQTRKINHSDNLSGIPKLFSHNVDVDRVNGEMLANLSGKQWMFSMISQGAEALTASLKKGCLSPEKLCLKIGAEVMFTKNSPSGRFVNGTLGVVEDFDQTSGYPVVRTKNGKRIEVEPMDWNIEENFKIRATITQLPLRLAWAITVHKSQGMTLDEAVMDLSGVFEYGQGYVALSRVRKLSGLHVLGWNERAFLVHPEIAAKDKDFRFASAQAAALFSKMAEKELKIKHDKFITACGGTLKIISDRQKGLLRRNGKINTYEQTLAFWRNGKNTMEISNERGLKESTILNHIEKLIQRGAIDSKDFPRLLTPALKREKGKIQAAFRELGRERLGPIYEKFGGKYSYDDLRIARMILAQE